MSVARTLIKLREFQVNSAETLAYGHESSTTTNVKNALDWIFSVLYPNTKDSVDTTIELPLIGNSLNDYRVVLDDGDGKASGYRWEQREGEASPAWHKIHDMDWSSDSILSSLFDQTQEVFVYRRGRMDVDASGIPITGTFEGQTVTGGTTSGNLTLNANANSLTNLPEDQTGFVQFFGNTRPTNDDIFDLGTATERFHNIFLAGSLSNGSVALTLANLKAAYDHISITSGNPHNVSYDELISKLGTLTIDGDVSGSIDLSTSGSKTLTLTVANDSHTHDAASTIINFDSEVYGYLKSALLDNSNVAWSFNDLTEEIEPIVTIDTTTITNIDDPLANKILVGSPDGLSWVKSNGLIDLNGDVSGTAQYNSLLDKWGITTTIDHTPMSSVDGFLLTNKTFTSDPGAATVVTAIAHGMQTGEKVSIFGASLTGVHTITYLTTDTFSVPFTTVSSDAGYYIPQGGQLLWNPTIGKFQVAKEYEEIRLAELSGLSEDVLTQYVAKDGRSLGQTIKGGISASEKLTLESTSNAVKGTIEFKDNITPATDAVYSGGWTGKDVGSPTKRVNDLYMAGEAKGLRVENVGSLPASSGTTIGKLVTFDNKLYMDNGATYEVVGPSSGVSGSYAPINSPSFTGTPQTPTPTLGDVSTQIANTDFVNTAIITATASISSEAIGDTKLTYKNPGANWVACTGATVYKDNTTKSVVYSLLPTPVNSVVSTMTPPSPVTNGFFGQTSFWMEEDYFITMQSFNGSTSAKFYSVYYNRSTRTLTPTQMTIGVASSSLTTYTFNNSYYPYVTIAASSSISQANKYLYICKWNTTTKTLDVVYTKTISVAASTAVIDAQSSAMTFDGTTFRFYIFTNYYNTTIQTCIERSTTSEVWAETSVSLTGIPATFQLYNISPIAGSNNYFFACISKTGGASPYGYGFIRKTGNNTFSWFQTISLVEASIKVSSGIRFTSENSLLLYAFNAPLQKYTYNSSTAQFVASGTLNLPSGFNLQQIMSFTRLYNPDYSLLPDVLHIYNATGTVHRFIPLSSDRTTYYDDVFPSFVASNSNLSLITADSGTVINADYNITSSQGAIYVRPERKVYPTLANPSTSLAYYLKTN